MIIHTTLFLKMGYCCKSLPNTIPKTEKESKVCSDSYHSFTLQQFKNEALQKWRNIILSDKTQTPQIAQIQQEAYNDRLV